MGKHNFDGYESKTNKKYSVEENVYIEKKASTDKKIKNVHEGHRERLRQRFLNEGLDNFYDHNVLELLLFYSIPMKDTNNEAHELINTFGSLSGVFDASYEDLCNVKGIGERTATLIKIMPELFKKYEVDKLKSDNVVLNTSELVAKYASTFFKGVTTEKLYLMCLDSNCRLLEFNLISEGTINASPINVRKIIKCSLDSNCSNLILIHNHPSGVVAPSRSDVDATVGMVDLLSKVGLKLSDHIIIGYGDDFFSFRKSEKWKYIF